MRRYEVGGELLEEVEDLAQKYMEEDLENGDDYPVGYYVSCSQEYIGLMA